MSFTLLLIKEFSTELHEENRLKILRVIRIVSVSRFACQAGSFSENNKNIRQRLTALLPLV